MNHKTLGVVVKRQDFFEADKILTIFTERFGKIKAMARGVRKITAKLAGSLEPFMLLELQLFEGRTFYTPTGAVIKKSFGSIHDDLGKMAGAFYLGELIDKFEKEDQKSEKVFELLIGALGAIDNTKSVIASPALSKRAGRGNPETRCRFKKIASVGQKLSRNDVNINFVLRIFEIRLLKESGFWGDLSMCIHCKERLQPAVNYWDGEEGGIICGRCQQLFHHGRLISNDLIKFFRLVEKNGFDLAGRLTLEKELGAEAELILSDYIRGILESDLASKSFVKSLA